MNDFLPDEQLREVTNLSDFCGMLVFDKWTCNTNGRQAIFLRAQGESRYQALMIDQGFCFNAGEWNFPDAPLRGLYMRHRVYENVRGIEAFEDWLARVESKMTERAVDEIACGFHPSGIRLSLTRWSECWSNSGAGERLFGSWLCLPGNHRHSRFRTGDELRLFGDVLGPAGGARCLRKS